MIPGSLHRGGEERDKERKEAALVWGPPRKTGLDMQEIYWETTCEVKNADRATLFTIAKTGKQARCPSTDEWIKNMWHIHTMKYYSAIKKNGILPFAATWMDLEVIILK